jgi:ubiquinone/menaquinone biosynthesis C-methylase UbiE
MNEPISSRLAALYDFSVQDWPGEIAFYQRLAGRAARNGEAVLEVACGTGRIAVRLAQEGIRVVGLDHSIAMLDIARTKSAHLPTVRWVEADMRSFRLDERFGLTIIPGHSFQNLLTADDQVACLASIRQHLLPGGVLVVHLDHQDVDWLGALSGKLAGVFEPAGEFVDTQSGNIVRVSRAWWYERATQTAVSRARYKEIAANGEVVESWESGPDRYHCLFRFEMEHLLARAGFLVEACYGDFYEGELTGASSEMVWAATRA